MMTAAEIADELNITTVTVHRVAKEYNVKVDKTRRAFKYNYKEWLRKYKENVSGKHVHNDNGDYVTATFIARELGVSLSTVNKKLRKIPETRSVRKGLNYLYHRDTIKLIDSLITHKRRTCTLCNKLKTIGCFSNKNTSVCNTCRDKLLNGEVLK